jgi:hypothetical protein
LSQRCVLRRKRPTHSPSEHPFVVNRSVLWARRLDAQSTATTHQGPSPRRPRERNRRT